MCMRKKVSRVVSVTLSGGSVIERSGKYLIIKIERSGKYLITKIERSGKYLIIKIDKSGKYLISLFLTSSLFMFWYEEF